MKISEINEQNTNTNTAITLLLRWLNDYHNMTVTEHDLCDILKNDAIVMHDTAMSAKKLLQIIYTISNYTIYRGVNFAEDQRRAAVVKTRRESRRPVATPNTIHELLNNKFEQRFGHPFRNAVFASRNPDIADEFGNTVTLMIPHGDFVILASKKIDDLTIAIQHAIDENRIDSKYLDLFIDTYFTGDNGGLFTVNDIDLLLSKDYSDSELMIWCDSYTILNTVAPKQIWGNGTLGLTKQNAMDYLDWLVGEV